MNEIVEYVKKMIDNEGIISLLEDSEYTKKDNIYKIENSKFIFLVQEIYSVKTRYYARISVVDSFTEYTLPEDDAKELWSYIKNHNINTRENFNEKAKQIILGMIK